MGSLVGGLLGRQSSWAPCRACRTGGGQCGGAGGGGWLAGGGGGGGERAAAQPKEVGPGRLSWAGQRVEAAEGTVAAPGGALSSKSDVI